MTEEAKLVANDWVGEEGKELHQYWKELVALERALVGEVKASHSNIAGKFLLVRADSVTTIRYVNNGREPSAFLSAVMRRIWGLCTMHSVVLVSEHISGVRVVAVGVDSMSRAAEFSVTPSIFWHLNKEAGFGRGGAFKGYTVVSYASKAKQRNAEGMQQ